MLEEFMEKQIKDQEMLNKHQNINQPLYQYMLILKLALIEADVMINGNLYDAVDDCYKRKICKECKYDKYSKMVDELWRVNSTDKVVE